ncbi:hypothetical protein HYU95_05130 [Candidatus Daviesbacteria bacterium]|nr:hypothetical protein [Candidatus Daviesbacteria bacterium]
MQIQNAKFKMQNYGSLSWRTFNFLLVFLTFNFLLLTSPAIAADSTPSADIRIKLEELKKQIASKAAKLKQEINRKLKDKAYIGKVKSKSDTSLTLAAKSGPKIVSINQDTVFESSFKSKQKFSQKTISSEDYIVALGDTDETGVLTAKKIIMIPTADNEQPKSYLWGQIISISDQLVTIKNNEFKNVAAALSPETKVKLNDFVILTGIKGKNNIFDTGFTYIISGISPKPKKAASPEPAQEATSSAKTATPSAKKASPTPKASTVKPSPKPTPR